MSVSAQAQGASKANNSAQTIVLVHGAWADSAGWNGVTSRLQADGYTVWAVPNPLRGLSSDAAYVASILNTIPGPIILVAHSYGGAVITNAATGNPNVKALVYIDGFAPDEGETGFQLLGMPPPPGQSASCVSGDRYLQRRAIPRGSERRCRSIYQARSVPLVLRKHHSGQTGRGSGCLTTPHYIQCWRRAIWTSCLENDPILVPGRHA